MAVIRALPRQARLGTHVVVFVAIETPCRAAPQWNAGTDLGWDFGNGPTYPAPTAGFLPVSIT